eukprot:5760925-Pleurochrysis_carterae.AAC.1
MPSATTVYNGTYEALSAAQMSAATRRIAACASRDHCARACGEWGRYPTMGNRRARRGLGTGRRRRRSARRRVACDEPRKADGQHIRNGECGVEDQVVEL